MKRDDVAFSLHSVVDIVKCLRDDAFFSFLSFFLKEKYRKETSHRLFTFLRCQQRRQSLVPHRIDWRMILNRNSFDRCNRYGEAHRLRRPTQAQHPHRWSGKLRARGRECRFTPVSNRLIHSQNQTRWKNDQGRNVPQPVERVENPTVFHEWNENFQKIARRPIQLKPMTKDPYTPLRGVVNQVTRTIVTAGEASLPLISPKTIKITVVNVRTAPRRPAKGSGGGPRLVRYLRRNDLLPSESNAQLFAPNRLDIVPLQYEKSSMLTINSTQKMTPTPRGTPIERLLHRDQLCNDSTALRRPPRKLIFSTTNESFVPLSIPTWRKTTGRRRVLFFHRCAF